MEHAPAALESGFLTTEPLSPTLLTQFLYECFRRFSALQAQYVRPRAVAPSRGPSVSFLCLRRPAHPSQGQLSSQPRPRPAPREGGSRRCGGAGGPRSTRAPRPSLAGGGRWARPGLSPQAQDPGPQRVRMPAMSSASSAHRTCRQPNPRRLRERQNGAR